MMNVAVTVPEQENPLILQGMCKSDEDEMPLSHEEANFFSVDEEDASNWKEVLLHKIKDLVIDENAFDKKLLEQSKKEWMDIF